MSRSGYTDDYGCDEPWKLHLYRGNVERSIAGKRGQKLLKDLVEALDEMPDKRLIEGDLDDGLGSVCALGAVAKRRGVEVIDLDPYDDIDVLAERLDIAEPMAREIVYLNDEATGYDHDNPAREQERRWRYMREWAGRNLKRKEEER